MRRESNTHTHNPHDTRTDDEPVPWVIPPNGWIVPQNEQVQKTAATSPSPRDIVKKEREGERDEDHKGRGAAET